MRNKNTTDYWENLILKRAITAVVCGPPCETWTRARFNWSEQPPNPPPLRSLEDPWGRTGLSAAHAKQVNVANDLMFSALRIISLLIWQGGAGVMEHPPSPQQQQDKHIPSIWKTKQLKRMFALPCVERVDFKQSVHGQISVKPTTFMSIRLPTMRINARKPHLNSEQIERYRKGIREKESIREDQAMIGFDQATKKWRTAPLKVYPPSLCKGIALTLHQAIKDRKSGHGPLLTDDERRQLKDVYELLMTGEKDDWQQDYAK